MTADELTAAQAAQGQWAAQVLSRLLPLLVEKGVLSQESLSFAVSEIGSFQGLLTEKAKRVSDDVVRRLEAPYGSGHFG